MQIRHRHVRYTSIQKTEEPVGNLGAENLNFPNGSGLDGDEEDVEARGEFYVDDDADVKCNNMSSHRRRCTHAYICTYTNTYKLYAFKNMLLGTPYRLDAILSACTPLYIHRI